MQALLWEVFYMSGLVFTASFGLHYMAFSKGMSVEVQESEDTTNETIVSPIVKKWLDFGGGYYGTVAFVKLVLIEIEQIQSFFANWQGTGLFIDSLGFNLLIAVFVEQIMNFVAAIIWPTDYLSMFSIIECAVIVGATYALFESAKHLAKQRYDASNVDEL